MIARRSIAAITRYSIINICEINELTKVNEVNNIIDKIIYIAFYKDLRLLSFRLSIFSRLSNSLILKL